MGLVEIQITDLNPHKLLIHTNVIVQAGMQANQFATAIDCAGNMAIFTKNCCGKISFFLKTQKRLVLKFFCLS